MSKTPQRRQENRIPFQGEVTEYGDEQHTWKAEDLSENGIFVGGRPPLSAGTTVDIGFYLPGYAIEILAEAMVEWTNAPGEPGHNPAKPDGMGLMFLEVDPEQIKVLKEFLTKPQTAANPPAKQPTAAAKGSSKLDAEYEALLASAAQSPKPKKASAPKAETTEDFEAKLAALAEKKPAAKSDPKPRDTDREPVRKADATADLESELAALTAAPPKKTQAKKPAAKPAAAAKKPEAKPAAKPGRRQTTDEIEAELADLMAAPPAKPKPASAVQAKKQPKPKPSAKADNEPAPPAVAPDDLPEIAVVDATGPGRPVTLDIPIDLEEPAEPDAPEAVVVLDEIAEPIAEPATAPPPDAAVPPAAAAPQPTATPPAAAAAPQPAAAPQAAAAPQPAATPQAAAAPSGAVAGPAAGEVATGARADVAAAAAAAAGNLDAAAPAQAGIGSELFAEKGTAGEETQEDEDDPFLNERLLPGTTLGNFTISRWLGSGGMGDVYLAEHASLGRQVALKRLRSTFANNRRALQRFFDEARAVNQIRHENIVEITDFVSEGEDTYLLMEYLDGPTLSDLQTRGRGLPITQAVHIGLQVCDALSKVHEASIIHRDLKPQNIMLIRRGADLDFVKLLDFGIAKLKAPETAPRKQTGKPSQTTGSMMMGTPSYMAPEQLLGEAIDHRADVYALGVILYEMATGINPFVADTWGQAVVKHCTEPPPALSSLMPSDAAGFPEELEELIHHCLAKKKDDRPADVGEVAKRLKEIEKHLGPGRKLRPKKKKKKKKRSFLRIAAGGLVATGLAAGIGAGVLVVTKGPEQAKAIVSTNVERARVYAASLLASDAAAPVGPADAEGSEPAEAVAKVDPPAAKAGPAPPAEPDEPELETGPVEVASASPSPKSSSSRSRPSSSSRNKSRSTTKSSPPPKTTAAPAPAPKPEPPPPKAAPPPKAEPPPKAAPPPSKPTPTPASAPAAAPTESPADKHYGEGKALLKANKPLLAVEEFKKAVAANPKHVKSYKMMGKAYAILGRESKAIEAFERFVKVAPNHKDAERLRQIIAEYKK